MDNKERDPDTGKYYTRVYEPLMKILESIHAEE